MREVLELAIQIAGSIAVPALIVRRDIARLEGPALARSWPESSLWSAVVAFGPLCIPVHFVRTRRSLVGLGLAALWLALALLPLLALGWLLEQT